MSLDTLYKRAKSGKIQQWRTWADGPTVWVEFGQKDGNLQKTFTKVKPKNVGKANETTAEEQAEKESKALWEKKQLGAYKKTISEAEEQQILPMLAKVFDGEKISYPCDIQAKLNGVRCLAYSENGEVRLKSRGGVFYEAPIHLKEQLKFLPDDVIYDGELYIHGESLQKINKAVKKYRKGETEKVNYIVYDIIYLKDIKRTWRERKENLDAFFEAAPGVPNILKIFTFTVDNSLELTMMHKRFIADGYEGTIVRLPDYKYEFGHRSSGLLKLKDFDDTEFKIIGYSEGTGRLRGCVIWRCVTEDGKEFEVSPRGALDDRKQLLTEATKHIGRMLKVQHFGWTDDKIPSLATGIDFRDEDDM